MLGGKESTVDEEQQCKGLAPSKLSSDTLFASAINDQLGPHPPLNCNQQRSHSTVKAIITRSATTAALIHTGFQSETYQKEYRTRDVPAAVVSLNIPQTSSHRHPLSWVLPDPVTSASTPKLCSLVLINSSSPYIFTLLQLSSYSHAIYWRFMLTGVKGNTTTMRNRTQTF